MKCGNGLGSLWTDYAFEQIFLQPLLTSCIHEEAAHDEGYREYLLNVCIFVQLFFLLKHSLQGHSMASTSSPPNPLLLNKICSNQIEDATHIVIFLLIRKAISQ